MNISELEFEPNPIDGGEWTTVHFENGYSASVMSGGLAYTSEELPYEIAVIKCNPEEKSFDLCYDTPITDSVLTYQSASDVERVLKQISELPKEEK